MNKWKKMKKIGWRRLYFCVWLKIYLWFPFNPFLNTCLLSQQTWHNVSMDGIAQESYQLYISVDLQTNPRKKTPSRMIKGKTRIAPDRSISTNHILLAPPTTSQKLLHMCSRNFRFTRMLCNMSYSASFEFAIDQQAECTDNFACLSVKNEAWSDEWLPFIIKIMQNRNSEECKDYM